MRRDPEPFAWNFCPICGRPLVSRPDNDGRRPHCTRCRRFYYLNPVPAACCFVVREGKLLFAKRAIEPCFGEWSLPGGFVEMGETTVEAAVRELREETCIEGRSLHLIGASTQPSQYNGSVVVLGYYVAEWEGTLAAGSDVADVEFFPESGRPPLAFQAHRDLLRLFDSTTWA